MDKATRQSDNFNCPRLPIAYSATFKSRANGRWVVDTGANRHACNDRRLFESMDPLQHLPKVITAGGVVLASGIGTVQLKAQGTGNDLVLTDVLYMPTFLVNLFSRVILYTLGGTICRKTSTLRNKLNEVICKINISAEGLFLKTSNPITALYVREDKLRAEQRLWHRQLEHLGHKNVLKTLSITKGTNLKQIKLGSKPCYTCEIAKSMQRVSQERQKQALHAFDKIHTNVIGQINPIGKNGHQWAVIYTNDATRTRWIKTFKYKREAYNHTITFVRYVKTQYGADIKMIQLDGGSKYGGQKLVDFLQNCGIRLEPTVPYTLEQNGVSERSNCVILEKLRSIF